MHLRRFPVSLEMLASNDNLFLTHQYGKMCLLSQYYVRSALKDN